METSLAIERELHDVDAHFVGLLTESGTPWNPQPCNLMTEEYAGNDYAYIPSWC